MSAYMYSMLASMQGVGTRPEILEHVRKRILGTVADRARDAGYEVAGEPVLLPESFLHDGAEGHMVECGPEDASHLLVRAEVPIATKGQSHP